MLPTIGLIGAGHIGKAIACHLSNAGYTVLICNSRSADTIAELAASLGNKIIATTIDKAITPEIVIVAVPWKNVADIAMLTDDWENKIIIDTSNNILQVSPRLILDYIGSRTTGTYVAELFQGARVVKTFTTAHHKILEQSPVTPYGTRVMPISGNDAEAKIIVKQIIENIGFLAIDLGDLAEGGKLQEVGGALYCVDLFMAPGRPAIAETNGL